MRTLIPILMLALAGCALDEFDNSTDAGPDNNGEGIGEGISLPPPEVGEDPGTPPPARPDDPGCVGVDAAGTCRGSTVVWCENDVVRTIDCSAIGDECGWDEDDERYFCVAPGAGGQPPAAPPPADPPPQDPPNQPDPNDPCQGLDFLGECRGTLARWCDGDQIKEVDCAWWGQNCGWVDNESGYYCGGTGERPDAPPPADPPPQDPPQDPPPQDPPPQDPPPQDPPPPADPPMNDACGTAEERANVMLTNAARAMFGQAALACAEVNTITARRHSEDMCNQGYFSHTGRDGSQPWDRLRREGGQFRTAGENIAQGYRNADAVHTGWMNSPGHRNNILSGNYRRIGVGLAPCNGRMYWTQVFSD